MEKLAIVSVYDKSGLKEFVSSLVELGVGILSTGGTAKFLNDQSIPLRSVDEYTGYPEMLDGRVKTLHPKVHGGILARRHREDDLKQLAENEIALVDFVVVNLYPFSAKLKELEEKGKISADHQGHDSMLEFIDIGGPTMIRAAAKNFKDVVVVCDPSDYSRIIHELKSSGKVSAETRIQLAAKVFKTMAAYDSEVARYLSLGEQILDEAGAPVQLAPVEAIVLERKQELRYGENPHQHAGLYRQVMVAGAPSEEPWQILQGKELSYNNLLDLHGALDLYLELSRSQQRKHAAVIIKHSNPCGAALADSALEAFSLAKDCDPVSAFGGILVLSGKVDADLAAAVTKDFVEVVALADLTAEAQELFSKKKNIRLMKCNFDVLRKLQSGRSLTMRNAFGDYLLQSVDNTLQVLEPSKVVTERKPDPGMLADMDFAWRVCKHVKSNAIVVAKAGQAIGVGAGQMSRLDSARIAVERARTHGHTVKGSVAASDAFLPFPDTLEILQSSGVEALVQPGGSIKDQEVIDAANRLNVCMIFTGERHFRH